MRFDIEVISDDLLPAVRSIMATRLSKDYGYTQEEIAAKLEVTQPAVSQYMNRSRADPDVVQTLKDDPQVDLLLDDAVSKAAKDDDFSAEVANIVETVRDKGLLKELFDGTSRL
ncbi:MAG: transcriptional regulator [Candidatus Nanohaloarchaea archaeon]